MPKEKRVMSDRRGLARRKRVLFVDDQPNVAKTLSSLLPRDEFEFRFADNGEKGLERLRAEVFDLAIVDLRMPPETWGGLWLLRELRSLGLKCTALVLSGEAGQKETIEAMRLGARDFVVKDNAATELADRVSDALADTEKSRLVYAEREIVSPIALSYARTKSSKEAEGQLRAGLACVDSVLRFCALAGTAIVRDADHFDAGLLDRLAMPSTGDWLELCRTVTPQVGESPFLRWLQAVTRKESQTLVQYRNDVHHGSGIPSAGIEAASAEITDWLDYFFLAAVSGTPVELLIAGMMTSSRGSFGVEWARLAGIGSASDRITTELRQAPSSGQVYLRVGDRYVNTWPFLLAEPDGPTGGWQLSILDGFRRERRHMTAPGDKLRLVNLMTGTRFYSPDLTVADLS
jgi:DNA-binding response OmpR family regulator